MEINEIFNLPEIPLYTYSKEKKHSFFLERMLLLFKYHLDNCEDFSKMMSSLGFKLENLNRIEDFPFLPVRLFKMFELSSVPKDQIVKTMTSSGTTGQSVSKIFLDKNTSSLQSRILSRIVASFLGKSRVPMLILDCEATIKDRNQFSARAAGITGFSLFASKRIFAFDDDMSLNESRVIQFLKENEGKTIFLFGFTYIVYSHFYKALLDSKNKFDFSNSVLFHGGGWKKMISESVDSKTFRSQFFDVCGLYRIHDYYGMVEQTGTIHMECEEGYLHTSEYSDIIVRDPKDFSICGFGKQGIIQLLSLLPISYPGQSILTEDIGEILGVDDCQCGRKGKYFKVHGRLKNAEVRGCSDTYGAKNR